MKIVLMIAGALLAVVGAVWFAQGINILPGSFMTGDRRWAIYGAGAVVVGVSVVIYAVRSRRG